MVGRNDLGGKMAKQRRGYFRQEEQCWKGKKSDSRDELTSV